MDNFRLKTIDRITFREALNTEVDSLRELEQKVVEAERPYNVSIKRDNPTYYDLEHLISSESACVLVAEDSNKIVGTGYVQIRTSKASLMHEKHGYLGFMYVEPSHRGLGLNKLIMDKLIAWGKEQGLCDFYLDVYTENQPAIRAYEKSGFRQSMVEMKLSLK
jgi:ribosomal protein S18 acetylase RimI-like enzyme